MRKKCLFANFGFLFGKCLKAGPATGRASRGATESGIAIEPVIALSF
jgi:hypothetical protein